MRIIWLRANSIDILPDQYSFNNFQHKNSRRGIFGYSNDQVDEWDIFECLEKEQPFLCRLASRAVCDIYIYTNEQQLINVAPLGDTVRKHATVGKNSCEVTFILGQKRETYRQLTTCISFMSNSPRNILSST